MSFFEDIFDTGTAIGKVTFAITALLVVWLVVTGGLGIYLAHRIGHPEVRGNLLGADDLLSKPDVVSYSVPGQRKEREGWFFPGLTTSPTIILCHGYARDRADLVTMVSSLQKDRFNVFVFDFPGHGRTPGSTSLGPLEARELLAVVSAVLQRTDVDQTRVGIWGMDVGGYAAISAAAVDQRIAAIAVDSVYDRPRDLFHVLAAEQVVSRVPGVTTVAWWSFNLMNWGTRKEAPLSERVARLQSVPKLFVQGRDNPNLAESTLQLFLRSPEPRVQAVLPKTQYHLMTEDERKSYESELVRFFQAAFPPVIGQ